MSIFGEITPFEIRIAFLVFMFVVTYIGAYLSSISKECFKIYGKMRNVENELHNIGCRMANISRSISIISHELGDSENIKGDDVSKKQPEPINTPITPKMPDVENMIKKPNNVSGFGNK